MTAAGWVFMITSLSLVLGLNLFCFTRLLTRPAASEHMHAPLDIDPGDKR